MARFALSASFGLVVIPFRSFQMLLTQEAQARCLACIYEHLVEGGLLAFNVANPAPLLSAGALSDRNGRALHAARRRVEAGSESPYGDSEPAHDHGFVLRIEPSLRLRYVSATAMRALLMHAGFTVEAVYGWFDGRPFESRSSEMVWLVNKA